MHFTCNWVDLGWVSTLRNKCSSLILKSCKSDQETREEVLFIKARQMSRQNPFYQGLMLKLDKNSTKAISVENYEIRISDLISRISISICIGFLFSQP